jgi:hypothetical protein
MCMTDSPAKHGWISLTHTVTDTTWRGYKCRQNTGESVLHIPLLTLHDEVINVDKTRVNQSYTYRYWHYTEKTCQLLAHGRWFSPSTPDSSITKTGRHDIVEILLKVALNTINQIKSNRIVCDIVSLLTLHDEVINADKKTITELPSGKYPVVRKLDSLI